MARLLPQTDGMSGLHPVPFSQLVRRMLRELDTRDGVFDLPRRRFYGGPEAGVDLGVPIFGQRAASPFGPAAGPHTQLAHNIVLAFAAGLRVMELKTVQIKDDLVIPRPCIDARNIAFNVEWSQELRLEQSLEEYVKASMLIAILVASGHLDLAPGSADLVLDASVGYDLAGIRSAPMTRFLDGVRDAGAIIDRLRGEIPPEYAKYRDLPYRRTLSDSVTLSTFHGCPPGEIEAIAEYLMRDRGLHTVVKLNPTLLGAPELRTLLHEQLGYHDLRVPDDAFTHDATWDDALGIVGRLAERSESIGRGFGVKLTNTLIVENTLGHLPASETRMYLSGPPLHVLAATLLGQIRETFGPRLTVSFSAGIDKQNAAAAVALGLRPVTMCTDLLKPGGYGRAQPYLQGLAAAMAGAGARTIDEWIVLGHGQGGHALQDLALPAADHARCQDAVVRGADLQAAAGPEAFARWKDAAILRNTRAYVAAVRADSRYAATRNNARPKKVGSHLELFDCLACDLCVPVCPNDANFVFPLEPVDVPGHRIVPTAAGGWHIENTEPMRIARRHQIANWVDVCNDCGNCDTFCPEDGGPFRMKPSVFRTPASFAARVDRDGVCLADGDILGRFEGREYRATREGEMVRYRGPGFDVRLDATCLEGGIPLLVEGSADGPVDLRWLVMMGWLVKGLSDPRAVHFANT